MNIRPCPRRRDHGNTYLTVLWITMLSGLVLAAYLTMVGVQNTASMRSQAWNRCISVSEAGVEEALSHLYKNGVTNANLYLDGWWNLNGQYYKRRVIDECIYEVTISMDANPVITSRGYTPLVQNFAKRGGVRSFLAGLFWYGVDDQNYVYRTLRVETTADGMFTKALVAKYWIDLNGNNITTDSFDSSNPLHSTNGLYYGPWRRDNGDIATNSGLTNYANIDNGNANIYGHASTGPKGTCSVGPNGCIGSLAWHAGGNSGIQTGWFRDDMNVSFPDVPAPFSGGTAPAGGTINGTNYALVLGSGNWVSSSAVKYTSKSTILVNGDAVWWCKAGLDMGGQGLIVVAPNSRLRLYVGNTSGSAVAAGLSGNGVMNHTGFATNCLVYGMKTCTTMTVSGNGTITAAIYAPNAAMTLNGGGNTDTDFCGAGVFSTATLNGHFNFHYDEFLGRWGPRRGYTIIAWNEI